MQMPRLNVIEQYLCSVADYKNRSSEIDESIEEELKGLKTEAVAHDDQQTAKLIWCYETILAIQRKYLSAFRNMKGELWYDAWTSLERVEIELRFLSRHFDWSKDDRFKLAFIEKHAMQFQKIYPYAMFFSPAYLYLEKKCSICDSVVSLRNSCAHKKGEIYNGEMCAHVITQCEILEISLVPNPTQKYSVLFLAGSKNGEHIDQYDYSILKYALNALREPFDAWDVRLTKIRHPHKLFLHVSYDDKCPCESGKTYRNCCLRKKGVLRPHANFYSACLHRVTYLH